MRNAELLKSPIIGTMSSLYGDIEVIIYAEDDDSSYILPTDKSLIDKIDLIGLKTLDASRIEDFWGFYLPSFLLEQVFTPYETQTMTIADLDVYKSSEPSDLFKAYREEFQALDDSLTDSLYKKYDVNPNDTDEVAQEIKEVISKMRSEILLSFILGGGADMVYKSMKENRKTLEPKENAIVSFNKIRETFSEKYEIEFV